MSTAEQPVDDPTEPSGPVALDAPVLLGRYCLGCELASGGMATVYLAIATDTSHVARPIALKRIHPHLAKDRAFIDMFIDEARIACRLSHPNLCGVLDFGEVSGTYFMTMEYLVGEPLHRLQIAMAQRRESLDVRALGRVAAQIVADACQGLHAAHELCDDDGRSLDVVHRDVSPSNLFVNYDGLTRVVDFGIASAADRLQHTTTGTVKGKFGYMAPEHLAGERTDRRADVWALGVVLWEALTLRRLFRRDNATRSMLATLEGKVPPAHEMMPGLDPGFSAIVARAVHPDREQRYPDALAMARDLERLLAESGAPNARPEVAAAMREAFPTGEREKRGLVKSVLEGRRTIDARTMAQSVASDTNPSARDLHGAHSGVVAKPSGAPAASAWRAVWAPSLVVFSIMVGATGAWLMLGGVGRGAPPVVVAPEAVSGAPVPRAAEQAGRASDQAAASTSVPETAPSADTPFVGANVGTRREPPAVAGAVAGARHEDATPHARAVAAESHELEARAAHGAADARAQRDESPNARDAPRTGTGTGTGTGTVSVTTVGDWAQVYHRGRSLGPTPGRFTLPEGRQVLSLRPGSGGPARSVVVDVDANAMVRVRTEL